MVSTAVSDWEEMDLLVLVKAYPSVSMNYGEAVCVAGVRLDTAQPEWVRLFPVGFRDLPAEQQFEKYDVIMLRAQRHSTDRRAESYRPTSVPSASASISRRAATGRSDGAGWSRCWVRQCASCTVPQGRRRRAVAGARAAAPRHRRSKLSQDLRSVALRR